jgi:hypothetical protein
MAGIANLRLAAPRRSSIHIPIVTRLAATSLAVKKGSAGRRCKATRYAPTVLVIISVIILVIIMSMAASLADAIAKANAAA